MNNRRDIELLVASAGSLYDEGRYAESLRAAEKATAAIAGADDPGMTVRALFREAEALRMLGESADALARYGRILELAYDPRINKPFSLKLADVIWYIAVAFIGWAQCARYVPGMKLEKLDQGLDTGLAWLRSAGRSHWRAGLLLQRALLLHETERVAEAVGIAEEALTLAEQHPDGPGPTLASYRRSLAEMLRALSRHDEAAAQYQKVLDDGDAHIHDRNASLVSLASCTLDMGDVEQARKYASDAVSEARALGDSALCDALAVRVKVHRSEGQAREALALVEEQLRAAERAGSDYYRYFAVRDAADVAFDLGDQESARAHLDKLAPLARAMDRSRGGTTFADQLAERRARLENAGESV